MAERETRMHTPGPWSIFQRRADDASSWCVGDNEGDVIAYDFTMKEDAELCASAPTLLEALEGLLSWADESDPPHAEGHDPSIPCAYCAARAAVKAAREV